MTNWIEFRIDTAGLTPDEQTLVRALVDFVRSGPIDLLTRYLQVLHHWEQAPVQRRALALKLLDDKLPSKTVAQICGLSDRQLRRYSEYRRFVQLLNQRRGELPRGRMDGNGDVEE